MLHMTRIHRNALLPYSAAQMYRLVNDVEAYPEFVPWCTRCDVSKSTEQEKLATLHFSRGAFGASLTTQNELVQDREIIMRLVSGPFKHLTGAWQFHEIDENICKVELDMEFKFSSKLYELMLGPIFTPLANRMITIFWERAEHTCEQR